MKASRALSEILLACALGAGVAACGSSGTSSAPKTAASKTTAPKASASASSSAMAEAQIKANWMAFFNPKTSVAKRISLLQDGQEFASVIKSQASSALAAGVSVKVTKVTLVSPARAKVTYTILESGKPVLANQSGVAVYQDRTWKVGIASFCALLAMENGGKTSGLPAACKAAG
jgi:hypothetical protein